MAASSGNAWPAIDTSTMRPTEQSSFMVNYPEHAELLRALVPDSMATDITEAWVSDLDELLIESNTMQEVIRTRGGRRHVQGLRASFEDKMGVRDSDSALYSTYQSARSSRGGSGLHPCHVIDNMHRLTEIGGSVENGVQLLRKGNMMLVGVPSGLTMAHSQIRHMAHLSGWRGNVQELLLHAPNLLRMGVPRRAFIGRMALQFGSPDLRLMDCDDIKRKFLTISVDEYLMALIEQRDEYRFEDTPHAVHRAPYRKRWINEKLRSAEVVKHIGPRILQAYFRYAPPRPHTVYHYPHLADLYGRIV